jgi:plastocyanin
MKKLAFGAAGFLALCMFLACSSSDSGGSTSSSSTSSTSGGVDGGTDGSSGGSDAAKDVVLDPGPGVKECKGTYVDRSDTGATRTIQWDLDVRTRPEHCMQVKVGQKVKWNGDFTQHPLEGQGAEPDNPIHADIGDIGEITFSKAGTFGYGCGFHEQMTGAIKVVP